MERENVQRKLTCVRPPSTQTLYDVQVGDVIELKELPFSLGVMGDFADQSVEALPKLKGRRFVHVNLDNFDSVLENMRPHSPPTLK